MTGVEGSKSFSVVVPIYNSEASINELYTRLEKTFAILRMSFEVIFVNDNSKDSSLEILKELHLTQRNVIVVDLMRNYGQEHALMCGFNHCSGKYVITLDDDLQHPPEEIPKLFNKLLEGYDVVIGAFPVKKDKFYKNLGSTLVRKMNCWIFKVQDTLSFSNFRILRKEVVDQVKSVRSQYPYISGIVLSFTRNIANIDVIHEKRKYGKSGYNFFRLFEQACNLFVNYSSLPLKIFSYLGLFISILSFGFSIYFILRQLYMGKAPAGWTSIIVLISFSNTFIFLLFFITGIYISRILREISDYKPYIEKSVLK